MHVVYTHLLNELDGGGQVHAEVNELPDDAFLLVLLLLQHEHVVVEELLQTLVRVVDAQLLERVELKAADRRSISVQEASLSKPIRSGALQMKLTAYIPNGT